MTDFSACKGTYIFANREKNADLFAGIENCRNFALAKGEHLWRNR